LRAAAATCVLLLAIGCMAAGCAGGSAVTGASSIAGGVAPDEGVREVLRVASARALDRLGRTNGYLGNRAARIVVPLDLEPLQNALRRHGEEALVDDFVTALNRAAETAAPRAADVVDAAIRDLPIDNPGAVLRGGKHEATETFRRRAGLRLRSTYLPIVAEQLDAVGANRRLDELNERARRLPFVKEVELDLPGLVTGGALDGLFLTMAYEEELIRRDPEARTTELLRRALGG
jgi:hypothetical protein